MVIIRPVLGKDLDAIYRLSALTLHGLTSLPHDRDVLESSVTRSLEAFSKNAKSPAGELYLFVLEDLETGKILGTSSIVSQIGVEQPFYNYQIKEEIKESKNPPLHSRRKYLQMQIQRYGPAEIGSLFLHPEHREKHRGRLLSLSRFLFMGAFAQAFPDRVIAEMRGVIDEYGVSVFWQWMGKPFFILEFNDADFESFKDNQFIGDLMPTFPLYLDVLPDDVQTVIGQVHEHTRPARRLLEQEGFEFLNEVDLFEAGPALGANFKNIRCIANRRVGSVIIDKKDSQNEELYLIASGKKMGDFRASVGPLYIDSKEVHLSLEIATALHLTKGSEVAYVLLKKPRHE